MSSSSGSRERPLNNKLCEEKLVVGNAGGPLDFKGEPLYDFEEVSMRLWVWNFFDDYGWKQLYTSN